MHGAKTPASRRTPIIWSTALRSMALQARCVQRAGTSYAVGVAHSGETTALMLAPHLDGPPQALPVIKQQGAHEPSWDI